MQKKKIVFLTGTRADFGKIKSILNLLSQNTMLFDINIFITGMHMLEKYGATYEEVLSCKFGKCFRYYNQNQSDSMDEVLAKTIIGFSDFIKEIKPDMIVVHGDRVEALAGAVVGSLNNILVGHIEGGEVSGTVDEIIRHSVSKLSHLHFVSNKEAFNRLIQLGEKKNSIFVIGSPDIDIMASDKLPSLNEVKKRYNIDFSQYAVLLYHPVTTEIKKVREHAKEVVDALIESEINYIVIYPNNDLGSDYILDEYERLQGNKRFECLPSMRFEYFLTMLKNSQFIIGNSSAGIREAPFYGLHSINIGTRQNCRGASDSIKDCKQDKDSILAAIRNIDSEKKYFNTCSFGTGQSDKYFLEILKNGSTWQVPAQKYFIDRVLHCEEELI